VKRERREEKRKFSNQDRGQTHSRKVVLLFEVLSGCPWGALSKVSRFARMVQGRDRSREAIFYETRFRECYTSLLGSNWVSESGKVYNTTE